jgi:hypothetical protein
MPSQLFENLSQQLDNASCENLNKLYDTDPNYWGVHIAQKAESIPSELSHKLALSTDTSVRKALAARASLETSIRTRLINDTNTQVSVAAYTRAPVEEITPEVTTAFLQHATVAKKDAILERWETHNALTDTQKIELFHWYALRSYNTKAVRYHKDNYTKILILDNDLADQLPANYYIPDGLTIRETLELLTVYERIASSPERYNSTSINLGSPATLLRHLSRGGHLPETTWEAITRGFLQRAEAGNQEIHTALSNLYSNNRRQGGNAPADTAASLALTALLAQPSHETIANAKTNGYTLRQVRDALTKENKHALNLIPALITIYPKDTERNLDEYITQLENSPPSQDTSWSTWSHASTIKELLTHTPAGKEWDATFNRDHRNQTLRCARGEVMRDDKGQGGKYNRDYVLTHDWLGNWETACDQCGEFINGTTLARAFSLLWKHRNCEGNNE